ncbi:MAG: RNA polymerase sigma factor [Candidatus Handelsmanbacteria bacterium]|nr:RNA polymerase sigma factor [Candidatus Handelsmanbacteria bacterium]
MLSIDDLYGEYAEGLQAYATRLARDGQVAEDLVQEAFIRTLGHPQLLAQLNPHQRRTWLCQTVKRLFLDQQASRAREAAAIAQLSLETEGYAPPVEPQLLEALLERVPESYWQVLEMRYALGMNSTEIGEELGLPPATVRTRLHPAIARLRAQQDKLLYRRGTRHGNQSTSRQDHRHRGGPRPAHRHRSFGGRDQAHRQRAHGAGRSGDHPPAAPDQRRQYRRHRRGPRRGPAALRAGGHQP